MNGISNGQMQVFKQRNLPGLRTSWSTSFHQGAHLKPDGNSNVKTKQFIVKKHKKIIQNHSDTLRYIYITNTSLISAFLKERWDGLRRGDYGTERHKNAQIFHGKHSWTMEPWTISRIFIQKIFYTCYSVAAVALNAPRLVVKAPGHWESW